MGSLISSILSSYANQVVAIYPGLGGRQAHPESLDSGIGLLDPQPRIRSVPAHPHSGEASLAYASADAFVPSLQALALWPPGLDEDLNLANLATLSRSYELRKRIFDLCFAVLILPVVATLIALIGATIALTAGAPIFFRQRRVGRLGREFEIWKFRTMRPDSERHLAEYLERNAAARDEWQHTQKLQNDPRVTRLGRFLRKTSLDELPQIFNIFAGDMSFVGPRPIPQAETVRYAEHLPCYLAALPGITGLWQVSGRCNLSYEARVLLDERYVRQWTMLRDLRILLKTPRAVFTRNGAY